MAKTSGRGPKVPTGGKSRSMRSGRPRGGTPATGYGKKYSRFRTGKYPATGDNPYGGKA